MGGEDEVGLGLILKTHFAVIGRIPEGGGTRSQVSFLILELYFESMACNQRGS